jgi:hypothetical protein
VDCCNSPKNVFILYSFGDSSATNDYCGYSLDSGSTWTEKTGPEFNADIYADFYIDSNNYYLDLALDYNSPGNTGLHILKFNGATISSDANNAFRRLRVSDYYYLDRTVIKFSATSLIFNQVMSRFDSGSVGGGDATYLYVYDTSSVYPVISPGNGYCIYYKLPGLDGIDVITSEVHLNDNDAAYFKVNG